MGYLYVASVFGRKPAVASIPNSNPIIKDVGQMLFRDLGGRMTVLYHESGTQLDKPFEWVNGLLLRPSGFSITRTNKINGRDDFWWNYMAAPDAYRDRPKAMLEVELAPLAGSGAGRVPFITALIYENNFVCSGAEGWSWIYFSMNGNRRGDPLPPPWNLTASDGSRVRPAEEQEAIWQAYEELVAFASQRLQVVTLEDLVAMATTSQASFDTAKLGQQERDVPYCTIAGVPSNLDLYYPLAGGPWPGAVYVHGGGWTGRDKRERSNPEIQALQQAGFLVAAVNYRLAPTHPFPAMIEDVKCAVRFLRAHAGSLNLLPNKQELHRAALRAGTKAV